MSTKSTTSSADFASGLTILLLAQIASAYMGIYVQDTYAQHGASWRENLFYSHLLSLPLFLPLSSILQRQYSRLASTAPLNLTNSIPGFTANNNNLTDINTKIPFLVSTIGRIPNGLVFLLINALTQLECISGVNILSARASAVTVTIVLNVRKLVSFMLSTWLFGHHLSAAMVLGAAMVFGSGALYAWESHWRMPKSRSSSGGKKAGVGMGSGGMTEGNVKGS